jgi:hypothetical protein
MSVDDVTGRRPAMGGGLESLNVNLVALILALGLTVIGVKLTSFLPSKYYFSFSKIVDTERSPTPFLIGSPPYLAPDDLCNVLDREPSLKGISCGGAGQSEGDETHKKEVRLADRAARQEAHSQDSFSNIIGFSIRLLIPALVGFFVVRTFGASADLAACAGAAGAAILLCWPVIVLWKFVVTREFRDLYGQFMLLYMLGGVAFFYMARIGAAFGKIMMDTRLLNVSALKIVQDSSSKIIESSLIALISAVGMKLMENLVLKS